MNRSKAGNRGKERKAASAGRLKMHRRLNLIATQIF